MQFIQFSQQLAQQRGVILAISMCVLLIINLLVLSIAKNAVFKLRVSSYAVDASYAFQAAEIALWEAEKTLGLAVGLTTKNVQEPLSDQELKAKDLNWWEANGNPVVSSASWESLSWVPHYFVESLSDSMIRVSARALGTNKGAALLQAWWVYDAGVENPRWKRSAWKQLL